jgi:uncharacterized protein (TIGR02996 family)
MDDEPAFERAMLAAPDDDSLRLVFAEWLDRRGDRRGEFIHAWFSLRDAARTFQSALTYWANKEHPKDVKFADDFYDFYAAVFTYQQVACAVDRDWLCRLGAVRPWVNLNVGLLIATYLVWDYGFDWQAVTAQGSISLERAWLFRYETAVTPCRQEGSDCPGWYLVHKFLGRCREVDSREPLSVMWGLEG